MPLNMMEKQFKKQKFKIFSKIISIIVISKGFNVNKVIVGKYQRKIINHLGVKNAECNKKLNLSENNRRGRRKFISSNY